ncbi:PREDICTED: selenoprotein M, partial [Myotis brandtii]|uniref:selenoprotein M n=1 Tax=Myotis brandtii TaxID=109478 RepID=UPI000704228E
MALRLRPLPPPPVLLLLAALTAATTTFRPDWNRLHGLARARVEVSASAAPSPGTTVPFRSQDSSDSQVPIGSGPSLSLRSLRTPYSSHNLVMKHLPGADPELVLLGHRHEELEVRPGEADGRGGGGAKAGRGAL